MFPNCYVFPRSNPHISAALSRPWPARSSGPDGESKADAQPYRAWAYPTRLLPPWIVLGRAARRLRACPGACQFGLRGGRLPAGRPLRPAAGALARMSRERWRGPFRRVVDNRGPASPRATNKEPTVRYGNIARRRSNLLFDKSIRNINIRDGKGTGGVVTCRPLTACCVAKRYRSEPG